jgi:hypothetical protein
MSHTYRRVLLQSRHLIRERMQTRGCLRPVVSSIPRAGSWNARSTHLDEETVSERHVDDRLVIVK